MSFFCHRRLSVFSTLFLAAVVLPALLLTGCHSERQAKADLTETRLQKLSMAMALYSNDYDHTLPPAKDEAAVKSFLLPYLVKGNTKEKDPAKLQEVFIAPMSGQEFVFNYSLAGTRLNIQKKSDGSQHLVNSKIVFYEPTAEWKDSQRFAVTQDGIVRRVPGNAWSQLKKENDIP